MGKYCPHCGTQSVDEANFCMKCGYNFGDVKVVGPAEQPAAEAAPKSQPSQARPWIQNSGVVNPNPVAGYEVYNPTFHCRCEYCYYEFDYHTYDLGHRAWYPHGFVYCPRCHRPLRHKLEYEVVSNVTTQQPAADTAAAPQPEEAVPENKE